MGVANWAGYWDLEFCCHWIIFYHWRQPFKLLYLHRTFLNGKYLSSPFSQLKFYSRCVPHGFLSSCLCPSFPLVLIFSSPYFHLAILPFIKVYLDSSFSGKAPLTPLLGVLSPSSISLDTFSCFLMACTVPLPTWYDKPISSSFLDCTFEITTVHCRFRFRRIVVMSAHTFLMNYSRIKCI